MTEESVPVIYAVGSKSPLSWNHLLSDFRIERQVGEH